MSEQDESRQRLELQVQELKKAEAQGTKLKAKTLHEQRMETRALENVIRPGDVLGPMVERFAALAKEAEVFFANLKKQIAQAPKECCSEHPETPLLVDQERTNFQSWQAKELHIVWGKCPECEKVFQESFVNEKWRKMGIPGELMKATLDSFETKTVQQVEAMGKTKMQVNKGSGFLIIRGKVGTGKSHLAVGVIKHFREGLFVTEADLIGELRQTYSENSGQEKMVAKYRETPVLVLDELSIEVKGVDIPQLLYRILGYRYSNSLFTVITSNESLQTILDILGPRLTDRVRENYRIATLEGTTYRKRRE